MALYAFSAWLLCISYALVMGSWHGPTQTWTFPVIFALATPAVIYAILWLSRAPWDVRRHFDRSLGREQAAWAGAVCQNISTPALTLQSGVVKVANQAVLKLLDYIDLSDEVIGVPFTNFLHPIDHEPFARLTSSASAPQSSGAEGILRLVTSHGNPVKVHASVSRLPSLPDGLMLQLNPPGSEAVPRGSEDYMSIVFDQLDLVLFQTNEDGLILYVNRTWERITGRTIERSRGTLLYSALFPDDRQTLETGFLSISRGEMERFQADVRLVGNTGSLAWVTVSARSCTLPDGHLVGIVGTIAEATRRKRAEEGLGSASRYMNLLLGNVPGMVYRGRNDRSWTMDFVSDGCLELTGYEPYELIKNHRVAYGDLIDPPDRDSVWQQVQAQLKHHRAFRLTYRITDAHGQRRHVWHQGRGVFSSQGELLGIEGFAADMENLQEFGGNRDSDGREACGDLMSRPLFERYLGLVMRHSKLHAVPYAVLCIAVSARAEPQGLDGSGRPEEHLAVLARRLDAVRRPGVEIGCLDECQFGVILEDVGDPAVGASLPQRIMLAASELADRLLCILSEPVTVRNETREVAVSCGIAIGAARYEGCGEILEAAHKAAIQAASLGPGHSEVADE